MQRGLPWWLSGNESACQCRRPWFRSLIREDPTRCEQLAHVAQLLSQCSRTWEPQRVSHVCPRACTLQWETPLQWEALSTQPEESCLPQLQTKVRSSKNKEHRQKDKLIKSAKNRMMIYVLNQPELNMFNLLALKKRHMIWLRCGKSISREWFPTRA